MAALRDLVLFYLSFVYMTSKAVEGLTAEFVFDALSRRFDFVLQEIENVKSDVVELKLDVSRIEKRVESMEKNMSNIRKPTDENDNGRSQSTMNDQLKRQSKVVQKMLESFKANWKERADQFQNKFSEFQSNIQSQLLLTNLSVGNSLERLEQTVNEHKTSTKATLLLMNLQLETKVNETDDKVEEMGQEVKQMSRDALKKINETGQSIQAEFKSDIESAENQLSSRLTSEISNVSTTLEALERKQEKLEQTVSDHTTATNATLLQMNLQLETKVNETDNRVEEMGQEVKQMSRDALKKINETGQSIKAEFKSDIESAENQLSSRLTSEISNVSTTLEALERKQGRKASFSVDGASRGRDGILRFSNVYLNEGSAFDTTTGVFTCPYPGLYVFMGTIIESGLGDNKIYCEIRRNRTIYVIMLSLQGQVGDQRAVAGDGTATGAVSMRLVEGDRVNLYCARLMTTKIYHSSFTGFLVNSDP